MATKRQLDLDEFLADHPVFALEDLAHARGAAGDLESARNQLKHHAERGRIKRVARGIYAAVPPGFDAAGFLPDRYLVAAAAMPEGIFAYHAALELLGQAHTIWGECAVHSPRRRPPIEMPTVRIVFLPPPVPLVRARRERLGVVAVAHEVREFQVAGPERTLVEGFRAPRRVGGLMELVESAAGFERLDFDLLEEVLEAYGQRSLWSAVGWFATRNTERWEPPPRFLARCRAEQPRQKQYLIRAQRGGVALSEWNLIVPAELLRGFEGNAPTA